jgi:hypothetical protein
MVTIGATTCFSKIEVKDIRDAVPELVMSLMIPYPHHFFDLHGKKVKESQFNRHPFFFPSISIPTFLFWCTAQWNEMRWSNRRAYTEHERI